MSSPAAPDPRSAPDPQRCPDYPTGAPFAVQLIILGHTVAYVIERRLARLDLNHTQAAIVMLLARHPGRMAQELAGPVHVEPASVTRAIQALERRGLVARSAHPTDGRASLFDLTDAGRAAAAALAELLQETSAELAAGLAPEALANLRASLPALFARARQLRPGAAGPGAAEPERSLADALPARPGA